MKHSILIIPLLALSPSGIAQTPANYSQPVNTSPVKAAPQETFYNVPEKREATPSLPFHDWKQTIAENNSVLASKTCQDAQTALPALQDRNSTSGIQVSPRRYREDFDGIYYYSGTPYTWKRSHSRIVDTMCGLGYLRPTDMWHNGDPAFELAMCMTYINFYTPLPYQDDIPFRNYFAYANDGYIVYKGDTIAGIVTVSNDRVTVETVDATGQQKQHVSLLDNLLLRDIVVYKQLKELHMRRPTKDDGRLWRQLHHGKLNLYDKRYRFITAKNIDVRSLRLQYGNGALRRVRTKGQLVAAVNHAYQLKLRSSKYSWEELFDIILSLG